MDPLNTHLLDTLNFPLIELSKTNEEIHHSFPFRSIFPQRKISTYHNFHSLKQKSQMS